MPPLLNCMFCFILMFCTMCLYAQKYVTPKKSIRTSEQELLHHLLKQYERAVRPVRNASHTVTVKLGMTMTNIFEMDEKNQVLTINVWLDQEWNDELLRWDPLQFGGIKSIRVPCDLIWLPDIVLYNNADDYTTGYMRSRAMLFYDGTVFWPPPTQLRSTCKIDVTYFPFDSQHCALKFGSWSYHGAQVDITNRSENVDLSNYVVSGEFDLMGVHQKRKVVKYNCCPELYPDVTFYIHIRRKTLYYMYNVIFPCMMMSVLTLLVFLLPPDSGEKIALGITVLLAFSVFVLAIAEKMPETSDSMPLIGIYLSVVMGMTSISVVMTVMVLNFHHRGPFNREVPEWVRVLVLRRLRKFLRMRLSVDFSGTEKKLVLSNGLSGGLDLRLALGFSGFVDSERQPFLLKETEFGKDSKNLRSPKNKYIHDVMDSRLSKTLQMLLERQEMDDYQQKVANEWRKVAQVVDRLLFWIFLVSTLITTVILLIFIPVLHRSIDLEKFDEADYSMS